MEIEGTQSSRSTKPTKLGDYALLRRIGAGAYGDVWMGRDAVGKLVAVKVIDRERLALVSRTNREERALRLLRTQLPEHPHLIRIHHVGNEGNRLYYVMDLADDAAMPSAQPSEHEVIPGLQRPVDKRGDIEPDDSDTFVGDRAETTQPISLGEGSSAASNRDEEPTPGAAGFGRDRASVSHSPRSDRLPTPNIDTDHYRPKMLLDDLCEGPDLSMSQAVTIVRELLDAVRCLHDHGIVHRDIKPSNIIAVGGVWKLADVGLMAEETTQLTTVGTPDFMPPMGKIDRTADLYALGKVLYCLATHNPPRAFPKIPPELLAGPQRRALMEINEVVTKACSLKPERRFQTALALDEALARCQRRIESPARFSRRSQRRMAAAVVLMIASVVAGGWWLGSLQHGETRAAGDAQVAGLASQDSGWVSLFNGQDLSGWYKDKPFQGDWYVSNGAIHCQRDESYKSLHCEQIFGPGTLRVTIIPSHKGVRMGIGYLHEVSGPLFMLMGDKYTWLRGYRGDYPPNEAGNWRSFPGPIPSAGEPVELQVEYNAEHVVLIASGTQLYALPGVEGSGHLVLHVWKDDAGAFRDIAFRPGGGDR